MTQPTRGRVITEPLGGSPLALAAQTGGLPHELQPWRPDGVDAWRTHAERRRSGAKAAWFHQLRPALAAGGAASNRLARVVDRQGVVVTTGQQPGLFGGPVYTLSKALTALELADAIEAATGVATAPVFWAATDDADFLEASTAFLSDGDGLHELSQDNRPPDGTPMSAAPLGDMTALLGALRRACGSAPHVHFVELARSAYAREATVGAAYLRLLRTLFEPLGIAVLDASHPDCRAAMRPVVLEALSGARRIEDAMARQTAAIRAIGFEPQVEDDRGLSLVFTLDAGLKRRLTVDEAGAARAAPTLIPNVLLRPVVEREVLPTVAYVAGPGELAYFAQSDAVAAALGRDRLAVVPRWSCIVLEPFVQRALSRLGLLPQELRDLASVERRLARAALPDNVARAWARLQESVQASVRELGHAVQESGLLPPAVIDGLANALGHRLGRAERRLLAAAKRRDEAMRRDLTCAVAALWPRGKRQERMLNYIPMLARGGEGLLAEMRGAAADHARQLVGARAAATAASR